MRYLASLMTGIVLATGLVATPAMADDHRHHDFGSQNNGGQGNNRPQGGPGYNHPQGEQGYNHPQGGPGYNHPQGDQGYNRPQGDQGYNRPQGGYNYGHQGYGHPGYGYGHPGYGYGHPGYGPGYYRPAPPRMYPGYARYGWPAGYAPRYHPLPPRPIVYVPPPRPGYWAVGARYYDPGYGPTVVVQDYDDYGLLPPPPGYGWRRSPAGDFILVAAATGIITDILLHH